VNPQLAKLKLRVDRRGAMLPLVAICLPLCVIMAAFALNVAWMQLVRTELRTATDSAARAGAKSLSLNQSKSAAIADAKIAAKRNEVAGVGLLLADQDIEVGTSTQATPTSRFQFATGGTQLNSVRVTGRRTQGSASGAVNLLFSGVFSAKQFQPVDVATSTDLDRDICLVLDRSGSMMQGVTGKTTPTQSTDCKPPNSKSRWAALDIAVNSFLDDLQGTPQKEFVGMVSYGSNEVACGITYHVADINSDLVADYAPIRSQIKLIGSKPIQGHTAIGDGLQDGIKVLTGAKARPFAAKTIILMTDGLQNQGVPAIDVARQAFAQHIIVHTITFSDEADQQSMIDVAKAAGGQHFHAPTAADLKKIFKEIASSLPVLTTQ
jgi:Ca-activated chloride channel family protein